VCCSVLQCVAVCCNVLQCVKISRQSAAEDLFKDAARSHTHRVLGGCVTVCSSVLQCDAVCAKNSEGSAADDSFTGTVVTHCILA